MVKSLKVTLLYLLTIICLLQSALSYGQIQVGCENLDEYLPLIKGKKVAIIANQTTLYSGSVHLVDKLVSLGVDIEYILSPEHGFRGDADAGEKVVDGRDSKTGIKVASLYGANKAPSEAIMKGCEVLIYDLQDVGVRYFTYISTMKHCMEAAAKYNRHFIIFDRPNPNGFYTDGPVLESRHNSFVGEFPIPVVYGMTAGELAKMAVGEGWISGGESLKMSVIECKNYSRADFYALPVKPSPNLPDMNSIYLYPSTCYFEATDVSLGRGTSKPFKIFGHPDMKGYSFSFTPRSTEGAKYPPQQNKLCYGRDLSELSRSEIVEKGVNLEYIIEAYNTLGKNPKFFNSFFEKLIGVSYVRQMIIEGKSAEQIRLRWSSDVELFKIKREPYLIYR